MNERNELVNWPSRPLFAAELRAVRSYPVAGQAAQIAQQVRRGRGAQFSEPSYYFARYQLPLADLQLSSQAAFDFWTRVACRRQNRTPRHIGLHLQNAGVVN